MSDIHAPTGVRFTGEEVELIGRSVAFWLEGLEDARTATIEDTNLTLEELLTASIGYSDDERIGKAVLCKLRHPSNG